jgi:hypothetical protein
MTQSCDNLAQAAHAHGNSSGPPDPNLAQAAHAHGNSSGPPDPNLAQAAHAHGGGHDACGDVHQAALISADAAVCLTADDTLDVCASVLHCDVLDVHVTDCAHA